MKRLKYICKDYEKIENYEKAKADNFVGWECHHRLETHTSDGERRPVDISAAELKALGMYWHRPADELIFLTESEHKSLRKASAETRKKQSEANKGKHLTEETKKKLSEARKGTHFTEEHKKKLGKAKKGNTYTKGMRWYNNGKINIMSKECPPGFMPGMLKRK